MILLVVTKKWSEINEKKFLGKARLIGEIEIDSKEFLVWQFYGKKEEIEKIFTSVLIKVLEVEV